MKEQNLSEKFNHLGKNEQNEVMTKLKEITQQYSEHKSIEIFDKSLAELAKEYPIVLDYLKSRDYQINK